MHCRLLQKNKKHTNGFSLIEMLVYISILVLVSGGALTVLFSLSDEIATQRANRSVTQSAELALERMLSDIRNAESVVTLYSTFEISPGVLSLTNGATTTEYSLVGDTVSVAVNDVVIGPLTGESITVDELRFFHYDNTATELVRVLLTLSTSVGSTTVQKTFNAAATLRGSYE